MADDTKKFDAGGVIKENSSAIVNAELKQRNTSRQGSKAPDAVTSAVSLLSQLSSVGSLDTAIGDQFFGINHRQTPGVIPINKDVHGYTFFTRPRMNFSAANIRTFRQLTPLLSSDPNSYQRIIRNTLDHTLEQSGLTCPFVDPQQIFIPFLTNNLLTLNGWPDKTAPVYTAPEGIYKETFGWVDGTVKQYGAYNLTATFRNIPGDPVNALFSAWLDYMGAVFDGTLVPYLDNIIEHEIDYQTRIWRLVMDVTKRKVQKIGCCVAALPLNDTMGAAFNFDHATPLNQTNNEITINFQAYGFIAQDPILIRIFNETTQQVNDNLKDETRARYYKEVPSQFLEMFNCRGYPRINPDTYALEWWVSNELYKEKLAGAGIV